ncbi:hypothetical protein [Herbiconiux ginsengi]|uniref:Uncharacterized protein n=1 Tax=Herbiconiux ginsengi TaxID=381665 RepID=A0A1H3SY25_9MICO|nr:hypothetical protein [Herbiconiux ginsengi]SDZ42882.1 hypothetical protein SAMN05216554_3811 [Herbiconiux ginsengi]
MTARLAHLVLALRIAYLVGAGLFLFDVVLAFGGPAIIASVFHGSDEGGLETLTSWIAVIAFTFAAIGAVITVAATSDRSAPAPLAEDADTVDPVL